tara:strand:+ start:97 stop:393 length:297 start_codon:yes stop_codon:yes gene_type:complete
MLEITLFAISVIVNFALLFYARWLIKILQVKEEETTMLSGLVSTYVEHIKGVHEMEMFYGDKSLEALIVHGQQLITKIEDFDYILYEREDEEGEEIDE